MTSNHKHKHPYSTTTALQESFGGTSPEAQPEHRVGTGLSAAFPGAGGRGSWPSAW